MTDPAIPSNFSGLTRNISSNTKFYQRSHDNLSSGENANQLGMAPLMSNCPKDRDARVNVVDGLEFDVLSWPGSNSI
jgi:hypothetical protein